MRDPALDELSDDGPDLTDPSWWASGPDITDAILAELRSAPARRFPEPAIGALGRGPGFVALTRHADITSASRRSDLFAGGNIADLGEVGPIDVSFHGERLDPGDPRHHQAARILSRGRGRPTDGADDGVAHDEFRRVVSRAMTPRRVEQVSTHLSDLAREVVNGVCERGACDLVDEVAARFPLRVLLDLLGMPRSHEQFVLERSNVILGLSEPAYAPDRTDDGVVSTALTAGQELGELVRDVCALRRATPGDDLISDLVHAERMDDAQLASYVSILLTAGNETTRNAISHGVLAFSEHPEQRAVWAADPTATASAVEEILRWSTPVRHFRRTCTTNGTRIGDVELAAGEQVVLWYGAGNRDPSVFDRPDEFDIRRAPGRQLAFGAPGAHFCLGANLARREIAVMLGELMSRLPDLVPAGPPVRMRSSFLNGICHLPVSFEPGAPA